MNGILSERIKTCFMKKVDKIRSLDTFLFKKYKGMKFDCQKNKGYLNLWSHDRYGGDLPQVKHG